MAQKKYIENKKKEIGNDIYKKTAAAYRRNRRLELGETKKQREVLTLEEKKMRDRELARIRSKRYREKIKLEKNKKL